MILFPNEIPNNVYRLVHNVGEFVVKFFGTNDHYWVSRGRVFLFQEGDEGQKLRSNNKVDTEFKKAIEEATQAYQRKQGLWTF